MNSNRGNMTRRQFAKLSAGALASITSRRFPLAQAAVKSLAPLDEVRYGDVVITSPLHHSQLAGTHELLMSLSEDSLLRPFRQMAGQAAPGDDLGGWYNYDPNYDWHRDDAGFAPGSTFGQWISALARCYAITGCEKTRDKVLRLNRLYGRAISPDFFANHRFPAYCYDKLVMGLLDSHKLVSDNSALALLYETTNAALPHLPKKAIDREVEWRQGKDQSFRWDESYTCPENLFLAYQRGAGIRYRDLAIQYLDDSTWFDPLARNENVLAEKHAYSYVNSLSSAMQAYLTLGSEKHLQAAKNAFAMLTAQSFATGGWGPDEILRRSGSDDLAASLSNTHNSFETPCGSYAHLKLTRYLLRVTRDSRYGDSMERVMYNTVLGAKPLQPDGRAFYYADCNFAGKKVYSKHLFPCCSGTFPQVAADYGINAYFRDSHGIFVNLYLPSSVRWLYDRSDIKLTQSGSYPSDDLVCFKIETCGAKEFAVNLRIPEWAQGASVEVNGKRWHDVPEPGTFLSIYRRWRNGDNIDLQLPRKMRLEAIDRQHPQTVALLCGPLVLFATFDGAQPELSRAQLLGSKQSRGQTWETKVRGGTMRLLPYTSIDEEQYSTYLHVT